MNNETLPELIRQHGLRQGLRPQTILTYTFCLQKFFRTAQKGFHELTKQDILHHLDRLAERGAPSSTLNVYLNAFKFLYEQVLHRRLTVNINFAKARCRLPSFLTQDELSRLISAIQNPHHQLMVRFLYSAGLRISELTHLKVKDLQLEKNYGWVRDGKGGKDRPFILAQSLKGDIEKWININNLVSDSFLFQGYSRRPYSSSSLWIILRQAAKKASISKHVHPHTLRHSFATHLIENGYAVTEVQPLLGHSRLDTTLVYTHLAAPALLHVISPLDSLPEKIN